MTPSRACSSGWSRTRKLCGARPGRKSICPDNPAMYMPRCAIRGGFLPTRRNYTHARVPAREAGNIVVRVEEGVRRGKHAICDSFQMPPGTRWEVFEATDEDRAMVDGYNLLARARG